MIQKYVKKPVKIEALQFTGGNDVELMNWIRDNGGQISMKLASDTAYQAGAGRPIFTPIIHTLEGDMEVGRGDFVIKGVKGEFYPCKPDIFAETYDIAGGE